MVAISKKDLTPTSTQVDYCTHGVNNGLNGMGPVKSYLITHPGSSQSKVLSLFDVVELSFIAKQHLGAPAIIECDIEGRSDSCSLLAGSCFAIPLAWASLTASYCCTWRVQNDSDRQLKSG